MRRRVKMGMAFLLTIAMLMGMIPSLTVKAELETGLLDLSRQTAAEGVTMLKHNPDVLPLGEDDTVSLFGRIQVDYFACGYGSGGDVKYPYVTNPLEGLRKHPDVSVNEDLAAVYEDWCRLNPPNHGSWGSWPLYHQEMPLENSVVEAAAANSDVAVVFIGRSAGEDRECQLIKGSYYLTDLEVDMLDKVTAAFNKVVVLMNVGNIMDMAWVDNYGDSIDDLMYVWMGGMESGKVIADVLSGDVTPSGKLSATIANTYADYPSSDYFGNREYNNYVEDIFVGYRYFETFAPDAVKYPFGFGLSYTEFDITTNSVVVEDGEIKVSVSVENTGKYPGKEVVQVYYGAPQGQLGKAAKSLAAYGKTGLLQPGDIQNMTISFKADAMASYDDAGKTGHKSAYVLEEGDYPIYVGNSVRSAKQYDESHKYTVNELEVVEQLTEASAVQTINAFDRWTAKEDADGNIVKAEEAVPTRTVVLKDRILDNLPAAIEQTGDKGYKLIDVYNGDVSMDAFVAQLDMNELEALTRGDRNMGSSLGAPGNAAVFGGILASLRDKGVVPLTTTDGPSGIRLTASATLLPIGMTLACTWNDDLVEKMYAGVGAEMVRNGSDSLLAPGINIQRDPLCGRNFEYFSEDPLLTGQMGSAVTRGVQSQGVSVTPKHYAANNQEVNRNYNDSRVSERALREIYLKGFEICVKTAKPQNIMTSYNKINGVWGHYNYDLCTTILREEWGFDGVVMTDWWMRAAQDPDFPDVYDNAYRVRAQVDVLMPGSDFPNSLLDSYSKDNGITLGEIQRTAKTVLEYTMIAAPFRQANDLPYFVYEPEVPVFTVEKDEPADPRLSNIKIGGEELSVFNPLTLDYEIFTRNLKDATELPLVEVEASDYVNVEITQATLASPVVTIKVTNKEAYGTQNIYRIYFTDEAGLTPTVPDPVYAYLTNIYINGSPLSTFYLELYSYEITVQDVGNLEITADTPEGVDYVVTYEADRAIVRAESNHQAMEYTLYYAVAPQSDEFDGDALKDFWTVGNQNENFSYGNGYVNITSQRGDFYGGGAEDLHNYVYQTARGNWDAVTRIEFDKDPFASYHQIGVMVMQDSANYIHFRYEYNNWGGNTPYPTIRLNQETGNSSSEIATSKDFVDEMKAYRAANDLPADGGALFFKVSKRGTSYDFSVSYDGDNYTDIGSATADYAEPKFTLATMNGNTNDSDNPRSTEEPIEVKFDYVRFDIQEEAAKIVPIQAEGSSKIKLAADNFYMTSTLQTENTNDTDGGQNIGYTEAGEYILVRIDVEKAGYYDITPRIAANEAATSLVQMGFNVEVDGQLAANFIWGGGTGGWQNWKSLEPKTAYLNEGVHTLKLYFNTGSFNINWLQFDPVESEPIDTNKKILKATIDYAEAQDTSKLNRIVKQKFEDALTYAISVYENPYATQDDVDYAAEELMKMIHMLDYTSDPDKLEALEELIKYAETFEAELDRYYDGEVKDEFIAALEYAREVRDDIRSLDADYDEAIERLNDAILALQDVLKPPVNTTQLEKMIERAKAIVQRQAEEDVYLPTGWTAFEAALAEAEAVLQNSDDQDEIDNATMALYESMFDLRLKPNKDLLQSLLTQGYAVNAKLYTVGSVDALDKALVVAQEVYDNPLATQAEVNTVSRLVANALEDLEPVDAKASGSTDADQDEDAAGTSDNNEAVKGSTTANPKTGQETILFVVFLLIGLLAVYVVCRRKNIR